MKITKPTKDICDLCYMFYNKHKFATCRKDDNIADDWDGNDTIADAADELNNLPEVKTDDDPFAPDHAMLQTEQSISIASKHVENAKIM